MRTLIAVVALLSWTSLPAQAEDEPGGGAEEEAGDPVADPAAAPPAAAPTEAADADEHAEPSEAGEAKAALPAADPAARCFAEPVVVRRFGLDGSDALRLTDCDGHPNLATLDALSALAQPLPSASTATTVASPSVGEAHALDSELLVRLQRIADHFPGRVLELVSGYRPHARPGSRHRSGSALDLRVEGVADSDLSEFARTLEATGVGYYPNSTFVHVDVRSTPFYWVDRSKPGERPDYVAPEKTEAPEASQALVAVNAVEEAAPKTDERPVASESAGPGEAVQNEAALEAELRELADRALVVMNTALGAKVPTYDRALPERQL
jgi:uncharacterized protein YcbK (DUF882 family)